jgi:hypothetical protein
MSTEERTGYGSHNPVSESETQQPHAPLSYGRSARVASLSSFRGSYAVRRYAPCSGRDSTVRGFETHLRLTLSVTRDESGTHVLDAFRVFLFVHVSTDCVAYEYIDYEYE